VWWQRTAYTLWVVAGILMLVRAAHSHHGYFKSMQISLDGLHSSQPCLITTSLFYKPEVPVFK
jgi:hypothetical protein